jgi:hypothetical protein
MLLKNNMQLISKKHSNLFPSHTNQLMSKELNTLAENFMIDRKVLSSSLLKLSQPHTT